MGGGQKVRYVPRNTGKTKPFGRDIPGFCRDIPEVPEKFDKRKFVFNFRSLKSGLFFVPEIHAFTGFGGEISSTVFKVLSDSKVLFKHKMAVNGR